MAKYIDTVHSRIRLAINKETGTYFSPEQIDAELHAENMNLFNKYFEIFAATQKISSWMQPFVVKETLEKQAGNVYNKPSDLEYPILVTTEGTPEDTEAGTPAKEGRTIEVIEHQHWARRANDPLVGPEEEDPIVRFDAETLLVLPLSIEKIELHYLKTPTIPKWAYTTQGTQYIYDDGNSRDMDWSTVVQDQIVNRVLANLGISMREEVVTEYSLTERPNEER